MDSKNICIVANFHKRNVVWEIQADSSFGSEWIYVGQNEDVNIEKISSILHQVLGNAGFFFVQTRMSSMEVQYSFWKETILSQIDSDFTLCDKAFERFIEFKNVGVVRIGHRIG